MQHLPFPGTGLPKLIESYWTAKCEARKGGECLFSSSFFPFCLCFGGFGVLGFAVVEGFFLSCRFLPLPFCSPLCSKVRPGRRLVPGPEATLIPGAAAALPPPPPPTPVKPRQTHTNPNLSFLPPKTPTPGVQPGRRRGEAPPDPTGEQTHPAAPAARGPTGSGRPLPKMNLKKKINK